MLLCNHQKHYVTTANISKFGRVMAYHKGPPPIKLLGLLVTWSCKITWFIRIIISVQPQWLWPFWLWPTCHGGVLSWGTFTHKATRPMVKWQTKTIISPRSKCLWPPNLAEWWLTFRGFWSKSYMIFWSHGLARSREKLKPLYPH